jgi:hypothetical protein
MRLCSPLICGPPPKNKKHHFRAPTCLPPDTAMPPGLPIWLKVTPPYWEYDFRYPWIQRDTLWQPFNWVDSLTWADTQLRDFAARQLEHGSMRSPCDCWSIP